MAPSALALTLASCKLGGRTKAFCFALLFEFGSKSKANCPNRQVYNVLLNLFD